jgi:hypothetical protein
MAARHCRSKMEIKHQLHGYRSRAVFLLDLIAFCINKKSAIFGGKKFQETVIVFNSDSMWR